MENQSEEDYIRKFLVDLDGIHFLNTYNNPNDGATYKINTNHIRDAITIIKENEVKGNTVLEVGCGPNIMNSLIVSPYFEDLYPSDFNKAMRKPVSSNCSQTTFVISS